MVVSKLLVSLILLSTICFSSCEEATLFDNSGQVLAYGASFGECVGPCFQEMLLNEVGEVEFKVRYNGLNRSDEVFSSNINGEQWNKVKQMLSLNELQQLENVYGCPDCADGGAEWIEWLENGKSIKKVTFEYGNPPKEIEKVIDLLREQKIELSKTLISQ